MLFTKQQNLSEMIVGHLTYHPSSTLVELQEAITPLLNKKNTRQGWYKALRVLLAAEVIIKTNRRYSLNSAWASHMVQLSYFINTNYLAGRAVYNLALPEKTKQKLKFKFPNLLTLDAFWAHVLTLIAAKNPGTSFYAYNPHFWFFAAHKFEVERYFENMKQYKAGNYTLVGARTDFDLWSEKLHPKGISNYYCSPKPIMKDSREYLLVMADYYMSVKVSKQMADKIDKLFKQTKLDMEAQEPPQEVVGFFKQKAPCTMTIEKNKERATKFARRVRRYF